MPSGTMAIIHNHTHKYKWTRLQRTHAHMHTAIGWENDNHHSFKLVVVVYCCCCCCCSSNCCCCFASDAGDDDGSGLYGCSIFAKIKICVYKLFGLHRIKTLPESTKWYICPTKHGIADMNVKRAKYDRWVLGWLNLLNFDSMFIFTRGMFVRVISMGSHLSNLSISWAVTL